MAARSNSSATGAPAITGTARVGQTLNATTATIADADGLTGATFSYQWLADDTVISGATSSTYTLAAADEGKAIKVRVSFSDDRGNAETLTGPATNAVVAELSNSAATGAPSITGTPRVDETLAAVTAGIADDNGLTNAVFSYRWLADDVAISGARVSTYTLVDRDQGKAIKVRVSFSDDAGNAETLTSSATSAVAASPVAPPNLVPSLLQESSTVRVSNLSQPSHVTNINTGFGRSYAQPFCTGGTAVTLDKVGMYTVSYETDPTAMTFRSFPAPVVTIRSDDSGKPGTVLQTLTNPVFDGSINTPEYFTGSGYELSAGTTYWVVLHRPRATGHIEFKDTYSEAEDSETDVGWAISDGMLTKSESTDWAVYEFFTDKPSIMQMVIYATGDPSAVSTPVFPDSDCDGAADAYEFSVDENTAANTVVGTVSARDTDGDNLTHTVGGADAAKFNEVFALNSSTGQITVKSGASIDYESGTRSYSITVSVTDGKDSSDAVEAEPTIDGTTSVKIEVNNIDEPGTILMSTTSPKVGSQLRVGLIDPDGGVITYAIEWSSADSATGPFTNFLPNSSSGMTPRSYTPTEADRGKYLRVKAHYVDRGCRNIGSTSGTTSTGGRCNKTAERVFDSPVAARSNNSPTGAPTITGAVQVGQTLTATPATIADADGLTGATFSYQWLADDTVISGATGSSYTLVVADQGKAIKVRVSFSDDAGNQEVVPSSATSAVVARPNSAATGAPAIMGTPRADETLTAITTGIADADGVTNAVFNYRWLADDSPISGGISSTYTLMDEQEGKAIKVRVSFNDDAGNAESLTSAATSAVAASRLTATVYGVPESHNGSGQFTFELRFSEAPSVGYAILRHHAFTVTGGNVVNATRLEQGKNLRWEIAVRPSSNADVTILLPATSDCTDQGAICTGRNKMLSTRLELTVLGPQNPQNSAATGAPVITGTAQVGQTLTATTTDIQDADGLTDTTFSYQWLADDTAISGATGSGYTLVDADEGKAIKVRVSFTDDAGNAETLTSAATSAVTARPNNPATGAPAITGTAQVGQTLTATTTDIQDADGLTDTTFSYQWLADDTAINGATGSGYTLVDADEGKAIKVRVSFTDDAGNAETLTSAATSAVAARPNNPATGAPAITGTAQVGQTLTATTTDIQDVDGLTDTTFSYQWLADDTAISGATGSGYTLVDADEGKAIKVRVSFTDDAGNAETLTSAATSAVAARPNNPATGAPAITGTAQVGQTLTATTTDIQDADGLTDTTFSYQWLADDTAINGATGSGYTLVDADEGKAIKVRVSFTDDAGNAETLTSAATEAVAVAPALAPLTATAHGVPASHDGSADFIFELRFSEAPTISYKILRYHALAVTNGSLLRSKRMEPGENLKWEITVRPTSTGDVTIVLSRTTDCAEEGAICLGDGRMLSNSLEVTVSLQNSAASGAPAIAGTARVGQTLTVNTSNITDADGLTGTTFSYQWLADDTAISGATGSGYTLVDADEGKAIKVRVSFTDDAGNAETLTSAATGAVAPFALTAAIHGVPASHNGQGVFTFELRFSEEFGISYRTLRDHAFTVTGGEVVDARRLEPGKNVRWEIHVSPTANAQVTIVLPVTTDCSAQGAICTEDGRMLSSRVVLTVRGPGG